MSSAGRARRGVQLRRSHRVRLILALAGVAATTVGLLAPGLGVGTRPDPRGAPIRAVLSSLTPTGAAKRLSTTSLYAKNDPWKEYLASERVCPGGERTDLPLSSQADTVACLVNFARNRRGLRELSLAPILNGASTRKARAILRCGNFAHNPCGGDWTTAVRSTGYAGLFGENLYLASGPFGAPRPAVDAWLNSAPHRQNLFRAEWREQGLAVVAVDRFGDRRDVALWVNVLGDR